MILSPLSAALNHLLVQEVWARDKLGRHAGKIACFDIGAAAFRLQVAAGGMVQVAPADAPANVTIRVPLADLPVIVQNREHAFSYVQIEGDADFANTISQLAENLRWEAEHDLSRWIGDIAAMRVVGGVRAAVQTAKATQQKLAENIAEYFLDEQPLLVRPQAVAEFSADVTKLRDDAERLAKRIEKLKESR